MGEPMLQPIPESVRSSAGPVSEEAPVGERLAGALVHVVDDVLGSYPTKAAEAAIALVEKTTDVVGGLAHTAGELLSGLFGGRSSIESSFLSGVLGSPASAPMQLAVLFVFLSAVFWSGKLSWHRREPLKPSSALRLAIERPG
jgi:hypothetical protein